MNKKIKILIVCVFAYTAMLAQKNDSIELIREFIGICNRYKQPPFHLSLAYVSATNIITDVSDTGSAKAEFYVANDISYTKFGEMEQLVNDSVALLVSDRLQRMFVYHDAHQITDRMKRILNMALPDSSIQHLSERYSIEKFAEADSGLFRLQSRAVIYSTSLPRESINVIYNPRSRQPYRIEHVTRELIRLDENNSDTTNALTDIKIVKNDNGVFALQERKMVFSYNIIEYVKSLKAPVAIGDRIVKNDAGEFVPAKGYENYTVTQD